jgi:hypothetical protein
MTVGEAAYCSREFYLLKYRALLSFLAMMVEVRVVFSAVVGLDFLKSSTISIKGSLKVFYPFVTLKDTRDIPSYRAEERPFLGVRILAGDWIGPF